MIAIDANLLIYAYDADAPEHERSREWLATTLAAPDPVGLPLASVLAFLRLSSDHRLSHTPKPIGIVTDIVAGWFARDNVTLLQPTRRHWPIFFQILKDARVSGARVTDAHLAALAIEHGATFCTNDRDFRRFPKLDVRFPLSD